MIRIESGELPRTVQVSSTTSRVCSAASARQTGRFRQYLTHPLSYLLFLILFCSTTKYYRRRDRNATQSWCIYGSLVMSDEWSNGSQDQGSAASSSRPKRVVCTSCRQSKVGATRSDSTIWGQYSLWRSRFVVLGPKKVPVRDARALKLIVTEIPDSKEPAKAG